MTFAPCIACLLLLVFPLRIAAQTAALKGVVTDESGAVIPAARVKISSSGGLVRTQVADGKGAYQFAGSTPGSYNLYAVAPGFLQNPTALEVSAGQNTVDLKLTARLAAGMVGFLRNMPR
jgi:hypothetical protein